MFDEEVINVLVQGAGAVGKTSITLQFVKGEFTESYVPTIEDEFNRTIEIDGKSHTMVIIDTAGQEDFKDLRFYHIRGANCFIMVYAVDDENSLNYIQELYDDILSVKRKQPPMLILGNKCDLPTPFALTKEQAESMSRQKLGGIPVIETSAKLNINITESIETIARMFLGCYNVDQKNSDNKSEKGCCNIQ